MRDKQIRFKLTNGYRTYCTLMSSIFKLTHRETDVLACLLEFNDQVIDNHARKYVRINLSLDKYSVNNHIKALKDKGAITSSANTTYSFHPLLRIDSDQKSLTILLDGA